jgi:DNA polymerase-3 subunit epsilon
MKNLKTDIFACIDCETTGLDPKVDEIVEVAVTVFSFENTIASYETLVKPPITIPESSIQIHHITNEMVQDKPSIAEVLPKIFSITGDLVIIGHNISFDIEMLSQAAKKLSIPCKLHRNKTIDTLRLARLYGQSEINSLEALRNHFHIPDEGAHRAMSDVTVNIQVFKKLSTNFKSTGEILERLKRPILLKAMPLGKHKGRLFKEIPREYLLWAARQNFDQDLLYSIKSELSTRNKGGRFEQAASPFSSL